MAPKKRKAAAAAAGPVSASQPTPQRPNTRAAGRERRHSDASNVSEAVSEAVSETSITKSSKRSKRHVTVQMDPQVIVEEDEGNVNSESEAAPPACDQESEVEEDAGAEEYEDDIELSQRSSKRVKFNSQQAQDESETTPTQVASHPAKKMTIKRRISQEQKFETKKVRTSRISLPPTLANGAEPTQTVGDFTFSPFSSVMKRRIQERKTLSPNSRINDDDQDEPVSDRLILDTVEEVVYPHLAESLVPVTNGAVTKDKGEVSKRMSSFEDEERTQLQDAVVALQKEASIVTAKLRVLQIEAKALGFGDTDGMSDEDAAEIALQSIRQFCDAARAFLDEELPGSLPDYASNEDLLFILKENVREFANRLRTANKEAIANASLTTDLARQIDNLLTIVADERIKNAQLRKDHDVTVGRLTKSLNEYISEETRLNALVTRLEEEHRETFSKMNDEREKTVRGLEDQLDKATELSTTRFGEIEALKDQVKTAEDERDALNDKLEKTQDDLDEEIEARENAQADLVAEEVKVEDLQGRVGALEDDLAEVNSNLNTLHNLNETEQSQRVAAEAELDDKNQKNEDLEQKLRQTGVEANELRVKIYELQTKAKRLEEDAAQRDDDNERDLAAEVDRREQAEELANEREATIAQLQNDLEDTEQRIAELIAERDARITSHEEALAQKDVEMQNMEEDNKAELEQRDETIAELRTALEELEDALDVSQQEATNDKITLREREATIATLKGQIVSLEQAKTDLEGRVEREAMDMLEITNSFRDEINKLKTGLEERQEKLRVVLEKRAQETKAAEELHRARDAEMAQLKVEHSAQMELHSDELSKLKRQFAAFIRQIHDGLVERQEDRRHAHAQAEAQEEALKQGLLRQLQTLDAPTATTTALLSVQQQKALRKPQRRSKRQFDSGIGLENGEMLEEEETLAA